MISGLTSGYQTTIEGAGSSLSGGTRQRIGLARAFFGSPKILVLDEPNANLDAEGEAALESALCNTKAARTTVILVTHRTSIVRKCDKALVLNEGSPEMFGSADDVLQRLSTKIRRKRTAAPLVDRLAHESKSAPVEAAE